MKTTKRIISAVLILVCLLIWMPQGQAAEIGDMPNSFYLTQNTGVTCTLCSATMMIRSIMYINGDHSWQAVTEAGTRPTAWAEGVGLRWFFRYSLGESVVNVAHTNVNGISAKSLKKLLDEHPEGIVLYCGKMPHAVYLMGYEGETFYCADTVNGYSGGPIPLDASWLAYRYGSQAAILRNVTAYWYVSDYQKIEDTSNCDCEKSVAGTYLCTTTTTSLRIRSGHGTRYSVKGSIPAGATVTVTKASGEWAHVIYNGISGYASMAYLKQLTGTHNYQTTVVEPTCEQEGYTIHGCDGCGYRTKENIVSALGHAYGDWTEKTASLQQRVCANCGDVQLQQIQQILKGTITGSDLRIRAGAGTSNRTLGYLQKGDRVEILEQKLVGTVTWGRIEQGWISMDYVKLDEIVVEPPVVEPPVVEPPVVEPPVVEPPVVEPPVVEPPVVEPPVVEPPVVEPPVVEPPVVEPPVVEPPVEEPPKEEPALMGTITGSNLRIREGAGTSHRILGHLQKGDRVQILEQKQVGSTTWARIEAGWISMAYVDLDEAEQEPLKGTITGSNLRIREGAGTSYRVLGYLQKGDEVEILEQKKVGSVTWGRTEDGWISMDYVELE